MADDDVLSEEELDALSSEAADRSGYDDGAPRAIDLESFERRARLPLPGLDAIHESLAEDLSQVISSSLGESAQAHYDGLRSSTFEEYCQALEIPSHITPIRYEEGVAGSGLIVADARLPDRLVARRFGGGSRGDRGSEAARRSLTQAERRLGEELVVALLPEIERAWGAAARVRITAGNPVGTPRLAGAVAAPRDPVLIAAFTVALADLEARLEIALPAVLLRPVESALRAGLPDRPGAGEGQASLREAAGEVELDLSVQLQGRRMRLRDVSALRPGDVLPIDPPDRARLLAGDVAIAGGSLGVAGEHNAISIDHARVGRGPQGAG
jgi:flagellar motor switch protein FliM